MSEPSGLAQVAGWFERLLAREGAIVERQADGALFACLPEALRQRLSLPDAAALRIGEPLAQGEVGVALEGAALQAGLDVALARGQLAGARLPAPACPHGRAQAIAGPALQVDNAAVRPGEIRQQPLRWLLLELAWTAAADEKQSGSVFVAHEATLGTSSLALAGALLARLPEAEPLDVLPAPAAIGQASAAAWPLARVEIEQALAPFRHSAGLRLRREQSRLDAYYDRLLAEGKRRRGRANADVQQQKVEAIARDRTLKQRELVERFLVRCEVKVASALGAEFETAVVEFVVRRRSRERRVPVAIDPWRREAVLQVCEACGLPGRVFHACDDAVHLVCMRCKGPACRVCAGGGR